MSMKPLLTILVAGGLAITACGSDDSSTTADTADTAVPDTATAGTAEATVVLATDATLGDHLTDGEGRTVYLFELDQGTTTACTGGCASTWPPLVADGTPTGGDGIDSTALAVADGIEPNQVTYHGHLLYHFSGDQAPGDANGVGIPSWYLVGADGAPVEGS